MNVYTLTLGGYKTEEQVHECSTSERDYKAKFFLKLYYKKFVLQVAYF